MNNFANSLLHILLSWMRALFSGLLNFFQDTSTGFIVWLSGHWIALAVVLITVGVLMDAFIYMLRWRPQYVWRTRLNHVLHRGDYLDDMQFAEGYDNALSDFNFADTPIPDLSNAPDPAEMMETYYAEPTPAQETIPAQDFEAVDDPASFGERKRRSERHEKRALTRIKLPELPELIRKRNDAPIDARTAFHDPVYPETESYQQEQNGDDY